MIKVTVMYPYTEGARFDHAYYRDRHMPMVKAKAGQRLRLLHRRKGLGRPSTRFTARLRGDVRIHL